MDRLFGSVNKPTSCAYCAIGGKSNGNIYGCQVGGGEFTVNTDNGCNDRSQTETGADHCGPWPRFHCANYSPIVVVVEELSNVRHLRQAKL